MIATAAQGFAKRVTEYEAARPDYPAAVLADLPLAGAGTVVDLGAGTGKFTRLLAESGRRVVAVEPIPEMAARIAAAGLPVELVMGSADAIPLPDASADLLCCAQSFHWFDYDQAVPEIWRVLAPSGHLALIWNVRDERVAWVAELTRLFDRYAGGARRYASGAWRRILADPRFLFVHTTHHAFSYRTDIDGLYDRVLSTSFVAAMSESEQAQIRIEVDRLLAGHPDIVANGSVEFPYVCELHLLARIP